MLEVSKLNEINLLIERLSREELVWLNGYVEGLLKNGAPLQIEEAKTSGKLTIAFGTETGNSKKLAAEFTAKARKYGHTVKLVSLDQYRFSDLTKEENFVAVISTHGDGAPPDTARKFFDHLLQSKTELSQLRYSVLALGDSAYPLFCKAGEDVDNRFNELGAKRVINLQKCDVDFNEEAHVWFNEVLSYIGAKPVPAKTAEVKKTGKRIYSGKILTKINLNGSGSAKETYHFEIAADDLVYQPGDAVGIVPKNPLEEVEAIFQLLNIDKAVFIRYKEKEAKAEELLTHQLSVSYLPERVVGKYATIVKQQIPMQRIDLINLLRIYPPHDKEQSIQIVQSLEPITPRLYSISSSLKSHDGEVHITVAQNRFLLDGATRHGLCSDYLASLQQDSVVEFYIHRNSQFKLPAPDKDIIMIGPGTGVAPFRSFIEERYSDNASGKSWLFFGDQHFASDFLYQTEWQDYIRTGALTKMNVAFSRDQHKKVYVQDKMLEESGELFKWIEGGAIVYVCGAKETMSVDVEESLLKIIRSEGSMDEDGAIVYLSKLVNDGRYLKDVY
ncbi:sulfite reductase [NADPH] flavoprotein alpha-component [Cytophagales bacterium WSM2-2]|nr:sulfite reductase [NADPH] flavoprotein alpha-component [Cytophagales bacterium WSM2-2]